MKQLQWNELGASERIVALARPAQRIDHRLQAAVAAIVDDVQSRGWDGLVETAVRIDGEEPREVAVEPLAAEARRRLPQEQLAAIQLAARRIRDFHERSRPSDFSMDTAPGVTVTKTWRAVDRVGLYVPGGKTPLFSSLLMLAIPARAAGVKEIVTVTPPRPEGGLAALIALAAELSGIERVWTVGGAQAIAALALGAGPIGRVEKICGPGNAWVTEAKRLVASLPGGPAIDMPAGPSELMVIAVEGADAGLVAADLLSQAEHDAAAQVLLVTPSNTLAGAVAREVEARVAGLPRREVAEAALANARILIVANLQEAVDVANCYAPEHLSLAVEDPDRMVQQVRNAGAVFVGGMAAETFGDYLAGSSHVLPTDGAARAWGGVSVHTFLKAMSVLTMTSDGVRGIAADAAILARMEALEAHARAADARLEAVS